MYKEACEKYTECLTLDPSSDQAPIYYCNRAFTHLKQENYMLAINDADAAIKIAPNYAKGYYRRASAQCALSHWKEAVKDFKMANQLSPEDKDTKQKYEWAIKEKRYRDLGAMLDTGDAVGQLKAESIIVESSYAGPVLNDIKDLTADWVVGLMGVLKEEKRLHKRFLVLMLQSLMGHYKKQPSLVDITIPEGEHITVCGDTHGQFYDLLHIFELNGNPGPNNRYLFNGDFVDRGSFSIEVIITLVAWNLLYPGHFVLTRGNHEASQLNMLYG